VEKHEVLQHLDGAALEAVCRCGKDIEECACLNGHECTCGGDPRLCGVATVEVQTIGLASPKPSA